MKKCPQCGKEYDTTNTLCPEDGAVLRRADDALIGTTLADKYRIDDLISQGGMGAVYRGTHVLMDKTVAIKVLHPSLAADERIVARFSREARAASRISHPHALSVTDFGESSDGTVFLVMEFIKGQTLKEVIRHDGRLTLSRSIGIFRQIASALDAAHAQGVVHRDLKSDNIMLVDLDGEGDWTKVLDFGIAKIQEPVGHDPELTAQNLIIGTPQYMSPEQCSQSQNIDHRTDIYSMGIVLYEMLSGHVPFTGESPTAIMMKQLQDPPPSIVQERKDIPVGIAPVIEKALAKDPAERFQSAGEFSDAFMAAATEPEPYVGNSSAVSDADKLKAVVSPVANPYLAEPSITSDGDEETIIRPRGDGDRGAPYPIAPPPAATINPAKIIIPSVLGLLIIFAVVYAMTGKTKTETNSNAPETTLTADPNSQPVRPIGLPTGDAEKGIAASVPARPVATGSAETTNTAGIEANKNAAEADNKNRNANSGVVVDENAPSLSPSPEKANANANRRNVPPPPVSNVSSDTVITPPNSLTPTPKPKPSATPKPTPTPAKDKDSGDTD